MKVPQEEPFRRVAVVGLGLMGGSLVRALKGLDSPPHIRASSKDPGEVRVALEEGVVDEGIVDGGVDPPEHLLEGRDLLIYASPLGATLELLEAHRPHMPPEMVVTDVASLKAPVLARAQALGLESRYVGAHPMAGGTGSGFSFSREDLYRGARVWLVAEEAVPSPVLDAVKALWIRLGARPRLTEAKAHDEVMAWVSHLPQLTSTALAQALMRAGYERDQLGPGGRDMTRLAGSGSRMWKELLDAAPHALSEALQALDRGLSEIRRELAAGDTRAIAERMDETRGWVEEGEEIEERREDP